MWRAFNSVAIIANLYFSFISGVLLYSADVDENATRVIAMKGHWLSDLPKRSDRQTGPLPDSLKFETFLKDCAERRMGP